MAYIFTTQAQDTFQRANENPLSDGGNWTLLQGDDPLEIVNDLCQSSDTVNTCGAIFTGISWPNNQWVKLTVANAGATDPEGAVDIYIRITNDGQFVSGYAFEIVTKDAGAEYAIISLVNPSPPLIIGSLVLNDGDTLLCGAYNNHLLLYHNSVLVTDVTNSDTLTGGVAAIEIFSSVLGSIQFSNFSGGLITESGGSGSGQINAGFGFSTDMPGSTAADTGGTAIVTRKTAIMTTKFGSRIIG